MARQPTERKKGKRKSSKLKSAEQRADSSQLPNAKRQTSDSSSSNGERRQLTVMFCDLVDSTLLSTRLDPEELQEVVQAYYGLCATAIHRFTGHIAQYIGDGVVSYFGYPAAHEDDVQRAVWAGLEILTKLQALNLQLQQSAPVLQEMPLRLRIGIHTGVVVVGKIGRGARRGPVALGETPNIAARLQGIAAPNTLAISSTTYQLTQGFFQCLALGPHQLKGVPTPMSVYQVVTESGVQSRFEESLRKGLTPLVGREQEVKLLLERWEQVKEGKGQVALLRGEPGIGKSRLVQELKKQATPEGPIWLECRCSFYHRNSAFYPVIDLLQRVLRFSRDDSPEERLRKLEEALTQRSLPLPEVAPLLVLLLSLPLPDRYAPLRLTPRRQKQKILEVLLALLVKTAETHPVFVVWEDLQWADPSTLELLTFLMDHVSTTRIFFVLTFRPEFHSPWIIRPHMIQLTCDRLSREQAEEMVGHLAGGKFLPAPVMQRLIEKTDGIPLFLEELTKMVLESDLPREEEDHARGAHIRAPLSLLTTPATLHDLLMARLDRLGTAKEVAQLGAALGRDFTYDLLQAVSPLTEAKLRQELARLVDAELLYQRGQLPQARYVFKHALIQQAAYQSLLKRRRQQYHRQIEQVLRERFPEVVETQPELLAHHCTEAGFIEQAVPYWWNAGQRAIARSANIEAINHLIKGLELLKTLPDTRRRVQQELDFQVLLGPALIATKGYTAAEVEQAYARARELCQQVGETPQIFPVLYGLNAFYTVRAEFQTAWELGEQLVGLAESVQDPALLLVAHRQRGLDLFNLGEITQAYTHLEQGIALYNPLQHGSLARLYGSDSGVACLSYMALAMEMLGYPDQALQRSKQALTLAQELSHPFSLVYALAVAAMFHQHRQEWAQARERVEATITLAAEQGFSQWMVGATVLGGGALVKQGQTEEGIAQIRQGLAAYQATGAKLWRPYYLALLAEACLQGGQTKEGVQALAEALRTIDKSGERWWEAELHRLKGTLTLQSQGKGPKSKAEKEAEGYFLKAIEIARRQQAKSLELRATVSLARLWRQQGKQHAARLMLSEICGWFTEGFDTVDFQEAKALMEELA